MTEKNATLPKQSQMPSFEARPYGGRLILSDTKTHTQTLIVIAPRASTAAGISIDKLNRYGLRGHEGEASEHVKFLRFTDVGEHDNSRPLVYTFQTSDGEPNQAFYGRGEEFYSVKDGGKTGYWHILENASDRPIMLLITVEKKPNLPEHRT
jgi:hypothetical protein